MMMPERKFSAGSRYRYGFNGKEQDPEVKGEGNAYDFEARIQDPRLGGRFFSVDPLYRNFPNQSPYLFAGNNPIKFIDAGGLFKIDPSIAKSYPLIYKYLSTQLEKDLLGSANIINGFKNLNSAVTDKHITQLFSNNSGPTIYPDVSGGFTDGAVGHYEYDKFNEIREVQVNKKIFQYVENVLKNEKNQEKREAALTLLNVSILHEAGHEADRYDGKFNEDGTPVILEKKDGYVEGIDPGGIIEEKVFGIKRGSSNENEKVENVVKGIKPENDKFKKGFINKIINKLKTTKDGAESLPTTPKPIQPTTLKKKG